ncbi:hypothetical protein CR513_23152, partial [Mucuna pruriens]
MVNEIGEVNNLRLENQLTELTSLVRQLAVGQHQPSATTKVAYPFWPRPSLGPYAAQRFGPTPNAPQRPIGYQQSTPQSQVPPFQQQQQHRILVQGNSPSLEDLMKQLETSNLEFQQTMSSNNMQFQQIMNGTIQDLKMQIGQLANTVSHLQSAGSSNLPSQTIPYPKGNVSALMLRIGKELPQPASQ